VTQLEALRTLVELESPSDDRDACNILARHLRERLLAAGADVRLHENADRGDHLEATFDAGSGRPALVLCHYDTVWPLGAVADRPFRIDDERRAHGPGIFDMKASLVMIDELVRSSRPRRPLKVLMTSDEEAGSPTSRALIEDRAREAEYVLVLEPPLAPGRLKLRRKGVGRFTVAVTGRAAHAGLEPEKGISATVELAHQILRIEALNDRERGTTVNVGLIKGGTKTNVVPASAAAEIDVRVWTEAEATRVGDGIRALTPILPGAVVQGEGRLNRPPMELSDAQLALFDAAREIGASLGVELTHGAAGGGSDGNFTAALGVPTLDGLGCPGAGAHAEHEHILLDRLPDQIALLRRLLEELAAPPRR
jgi:glutamate carboxypeptidase